MKNIDKTHCPRNHPYDKENTRWGVNPNGSPKRQCIACQRALDLRRTIMRRESKKRQIDRQSKVRVTRVIKP